MQGAYLSGKTKGQMIADALVHMCTEKGTAGHSFGETDIHEEL